MYRRTSDADIFRFTGKFPLISPEELARLCTDADGQPRNVVSLRKRLLTLREAKLLDARKGVQETIQFFAETKCQACGATNRTLRDSGKVRNTPNFHFVTPAGFRRYGKHMEGDPTVWASKSRGMVDHDRGITVIHLGVYSAYGDVPWVQDRGACLITITLNGEQVSFITDAFSEIEGRAIHFEYTHSTPSSENGVSDLDEKVIWYNELLKDDPTGLAVFVFTERSEAIAFVKRQASRHPYLWCRATYIDAIRENGGGSIYVTPCDFDKRTHCLTD